MSRNKLWRVASLLLVLAVILAACGGGQQAGEEYTFGLLMVGPYNDHGWSQAHYDAGLYVEENLSGAKMLYLDKVNVADRPGTTPAQLAEELVSKGAKFIIFN